MDEDARQSSRRDPDRTDEMREDEWIGVQPPPQETPLGVERITLDPEDLERIEVLEPSLPDGSARSPQPRVDDPARPRPRLRLGDRAATPLHIIGGNDDRKTYNDLRYPWGLVCRIDTHDGSFGSGVLIGPRHVLTASHVIDWSPESDLFATVEVHVRDRSVRATAGVEAAVCFTAVGPDDGTDKVDEDYAVLVLDQRFGDRFGWMGSRVYDSSWDTDELWTTIGYAEDVAASRRPVWQPRFFLDEDALDYGWGRAMSTNADLEHGQSGSPMFAFWDGLPYVVAVVSAEVDDDNYCAGGTGLPSLVNRVRSDYP